MQTAAQSPQARAAEEFRFDAAGRRVAHAGAEVTLTRQEYALLQALVDHRGAPLSRSRLLQLAWGWYGGASTRTVDVHIQHLRKKLGLDIQTVYKVGYQLG